MQYVLGIVALHVINEILRNKAMSASTSQVPQSTAGDRRRVAFATIIGTTVEWYDFFIYASAAGLVFGQLFFEPAGSSLGTLLAFGSVGVSFLFRPLGAFVAGHLGDKY